jgi:GNAT superfamily N-acetyltransferase
MENKFARAVPQLPVLNVPETAQYYRDILGFKIDWMWGENDYGAVSRDSTVLHLCAAEPPLSRVTCMINVSEVDSLCEGWRKNGAKIVREPEDRPWNLREFTVEDNNGHRFRVACKSTISPHQPRERVEGVAFIKRLPTIEEYRMLSDAVGWTSFTNLDAVARSLPQSLFSIVAEKDGHLIGTTRVGGDGALYFYIMDVAVMPEMQGRGIGTVLMNAAIEFIRNTGAEHALTCLFTNAQRTGFYERFGFEGPETWLYGMSATRLRSV